MLDHLNSRLARDVIGPALTARSLITRSTDPNAQRVAATLAQNRLCIPRSPVLTGRRSISGDFTRKATLVPIPNTIVKLAGPMIVPKGAKVGYRRFIYKTLVSTEPRVFSCADEQLHMSTIVFAHNSVR